MIGWFGFVNANCLIIIIFSLKGFNRFTIIKLQYIIFIIFTREDLLHYCQLQTVCMWYLFTLQHSAVRLWQWCYSLVRFTRKALKGLIQFIIMVIIYFYHCWPIGICIWWSNCSSECWYVWYICTIQSLVPDVLINIFTTSVFDISRPPVISVMEMTEQLKCFPYIVCAVKYNLHVTSVFQKPWISKMPLLLYWIIGDYS